MWGRCQSPRPVSSSSTPMESGTQFRQLSWLGKVCCAIRISNRRASWFEHSVLTTQHFASRRIYVDRNKKRQAETAKDTKTDAYRQTDISISLVSKKSAIRCQLCYFLDTRKSIYSSPVPGPFFLLPVVSSALGSSLLPATPRQGSPKLGHDPDLSANHRDVGHD